MLEYSKAKKFSRLVKTGIQLGKGTASADSGNSNNRAAGTAAVISEGVGAFLLPLFFILLSRLLGQLFIRNKKVFERGARIGLMLGTYIGLLTYATFLSFLPSSLDSVIGIVLGILLSSLCLFIFSLLRRSRSYSASLAEAGWLSKQGQVRLRLQLQMGLLLGTTLGVCTEFICSGYGILGAAIGALTLAPLIVFISRQLQSSSLAEGSARPLSSSLLKSLRYALNIGALLGASVAIVLKTFFFPTMKTMVCGFLGAGGGAFIALVVMGVVYVRYSSSFKKELLRVQLGTKLGSVVGAAIGIILVFIVFPPLGMASGVALGALAGSIVGSVYRFFSPLFSPAKTIHKETKKMEKESDKETPFAKKLNLAISMGAALGGILGSFISTLFFPAVALSIGATLGAALGSIILFSSLSYYARYQSVKIEHKGTSISKSNALLFEKRTPADRGPLRQVELVTQSADREFKSSLPAVDFRLRRVRV